MVVTDLDDTLYKESDYVKSGIRTMAAQLERFGVMPSATAIRIIQTAESTAKGFDILADEIKRLHGAPTFTVRWMVDTYRFHRPDIRLSSDVRRTLTELCRRGVSVGLITDGRSATQRAKISALGLNEFVDPENIIISGETGFDKTSEVPFREMARRNPGEKAFLYIGDNPVKDFRWPNAMGWTTVMLCDRDGANIHSQKISVPPEFKARYEIDRFSELLSLPGIM